ncbi:MAG: response regulator transcription factor [Synergistaceae bacterium]|nr:response regulator transcription factor [Synergistaceae bacterium]
MKKKIVIVDDHKLFLEGMEGILASVDDFDIVGRACNAESALEVIRSARPDLVILDITMPDMNGIEVTKIIKRELEDTKVLILTMHLHRRMIIEALRAGADGYILKDADSREVTDAARAVTAGFVYLSLDVATLIVRDYIRKLNVPVSDGSHLSELSTREKEVLALISEGMDTKAICSKLCISRNTVDSHRRNLMQKLGCESLADLMRFAIREGAVNLDE